MAASHVLLDSPAYESASARGLETCVCVCVRAQRSFVRGALMGVTASFSFLWMNCFDCLEFLSEEGSVHLLVSLLDIEPLCIVCITYL